ncbi:MAG: abortive infection family protein [Terracidiphilus sp.]|jgi:hypothetical protein
MENLSESLELLQNLLIARATGGGADLTEYQSLRKEVITHSVLKDVAPRFLRTCRSAAEFWQFIKFEFPTYAERRSFIWNEFRPMFERIEGSKATPADLTVSTALEKFETDTVQKLWVKALDRRETDPAGAITLARTLLETICKHILDEHHEEYESGTDLPAPYKTVAKTLNIAPSQHSEPIFKQILGGCTAVVEGLGAMRNRLSDAHGQGKKAIRPAPRHAELAVNLAGGTYIASYVCAPRVATSRAQVFTAAGLTVGVGYQFSGVRRHVSGVIYREYRRQVSGI